MYYVLLILLIDVSARARQVWMGKTKEKFQELKQENWSLNNANQTMLWQVEELKQQMKELQVKLRSLEKENGKLKEAAEKPQREGEE